MTVDELQRERVDLAAYQPRQEFAHDTFNEVDELLYGGAAFGGKTEFGTRYAAQFGGIWFPNVPLAVFRENLDELDRTLIPRFCSLVDPSGIGKYRSSQRAYHFNNGSVVYFLHCETDADVNQYLTEQWAYLWLEEASQFSRYRSLMLRGRVRSARADVPTKTLLTSNPDGIGNDWLVEEFVDHDPAGTGRVHLDNVTVQMPRSSKTVTFSKRRAFIQAFAEDNPIGMAADLNYMHSLAKLPEDEKRAKLYGDWTRPAGQFFKEWSRAKHLFDPAEEWPEEGVPPRHFAVWRALDFGYDPDPLCCLWFAQDPDTARIFVWQELYEKRLTDPDAKKLIRQMSADRLYGLSPADTSGKAKASSTSVSTWEIYGREPNAVPLQPANKNRIEGWRAVRAGLRDLEDGRPAVLVANHCIHLARTLPKLIYHKLKPGDIAERQDDHPADTLRYGLLARQAVTPALAEVRPPRPERIARDRTKQRQYKPPFQRVRFANRG